ncbi:MBL fold metallo-hydrolase [Gordonia sp. CPCC 206044]|uniref:MBL fold metallo-hydrolase n=1 Tax=Gordonia sp. CPCC 206044 TaxID=3140793 RepID=UPI003AF3B7C5
MSPENVTINDTYTGDLSQAPAPQRRTIDSATIVKLSVGPMDNNVYVITSNKTGDQLIIDAANDAERILEVVDALPGTPRLIFTTHQHFDHWQALAEVTDKLGVPTAAGRLDADELPVSPARLIDDGETIEVGDLTFDAIHLVGHTPGSIALALTDTDGTVHLFTGDCLFPGGPGRTIHPDEFESLMSGLETKVFDRYDDSTIVYPGHGKDTDLGAERPSLAEWRARGW